MTPAELTAWRTRMGWLKGEAAKALGLSLNGYGAYERGWVWSRDEDQMVQAPRSIPKHVEFAAAYLELEKNSAKAD